MSAKKGVFPPPLPPLVHRWLHTGMVEVLAEVRYPDGRMLRVAPTLPRKGGLYEDLYHYKLRDVRVLQKDVDEVRTKRGSDDLTPDVLVEAAHVAWNRTQLENFKLRIQDLREALKGDFGLNMNASNVQERLRSSHTPS